MFNFLIKNNLAENVVKRCHKCKAFHNLTLLTRQSLVHVSRPFALNNDFGVGVEFPMENKNGLKYVDNCSQELMARDAFA